MKISELQNHIKASISQCLVDEGFLAVKKQTFYNQKNNIIRIVHIDFLDKKNASYFNSNTASFSLMLGVHFNFENHTDFHPKEYESHIRGCLLRNFSQKHPMDLKGFAFFHPERKRRDIWWIKNDASDLESLLDKANSAIDKNAVRWLEKFSDVNYVIKFLQKKKEIDSHRGGPFGFGPPGSPLRSNLIKQLQNKIKE